MKLVLLLDQALERVSRWGIIFSLFVILILAVGSIVLRWMGQSLLWMEPLIRHLVFLTAFLGGSLATGRNEHIKVDVLTKLIEKSPSKILHWFHRSLIAFFCFIVCAGLTKSGWDFYLSEKEFGAPSFLDIHSSVLVGIIPAGMALITLRFMNKFLMSLFQAEVK